MEAVCRYLMSIVIASLVCGILLSLVDKKSAQHGLIRLLCGIFLSIMAIKPLIHIQLDDFLLYSQTIQTDAQSAVAYGQNLGKEQRLQFITQQTQAYILDKAASMDASLDVQVSLDEDTCLPDSVTLSGSIAPLARTRLAQILETDLGIAKEDQRWIG